MNSLLCKTIGLNFLHYLALYASRPYLSLLAQELGGDPLEIGLVVSLYSVIQVAAALPAGRWIAHGGLRHASVWGGVIFTVGTLLLIASSCLWLVGAAAFMMGLGHSFLLLCGQHMVTGAVKETERAKAVGLLSFFNSAGTFLGPVLGGWLQDDIGRRFGFLGAALLSAAGLGAALCMPAQPACAQQERVDFHKEQQSGQMLRDVAMSGAVFFATDILSTYLPLYGSNMGLSAMLVGAILSANGMAQMAVRPFMGCLCAHRPARQVLRRCLLVGGVGTACLGFSGRFWPLLAVSVGIGCMIGLANPLTLLVVSDSAGSARSRALALRVIANYGGQTLSPILFGMLAESCGFAAVFWSSGSVLLLCGLAGGSREQRSQYGKKRRKGS